LKRRAIGVELSRSYWQDGLGYLKLAENKMNTPTLFDLLPEGDEAFLPEEIEADTNAIL